MTDNWQEVDLKRMDIGWDSLTKLIQDGKKPEILVPTNDLGDINVKIGHITLEGDFIGIVIEKAKPETQLSDSLVKFMELARQQGRVLAVRFSKEGKYKLLSLDLQSEERESK